MILFSFERRFLTSTTRERSLILSWFLRDASLVRNFLTDAQHVLARQYARYGEGRGVPTNHNIQLERRDHPECHGAVEQNADANAEPARGGELP
jgi:hypothetical protein